MLLFNSEAELRYSVLSEKRSCNKDDMTPTSPRRYVTHSIANILPPSPRCYVTHSIANILMPITHSISSILMPRGRSRNQVFPFLRMKAGMAPKRFLFQKFGKTLGSPQVERDRLQEIEAGKVRSCDSGEFKPKKKGDHRESR